MSNSNIIVNLVFEILGNKHDLHTKLMKHLDKYDLCQNGDSHTSIGRPHLQKPEKIKWSLPIASKLAIWR